MNSKDKEQLTWGIILLIIGLGVIAFVLINKVTYSSNTESTYLCIPIVGIVLIWQAIKKNKK